MSEPITKERLEALPALRREITRLKERLKRLEAQVSESPRYAAALAETRATLESLLVQAQVESAAVLSYIRGIGDVTTREIFMLRYYDGVRTWQEVAFAIGEYDESYVRKRVHKELQRQKNE